MRSPPRRRPISSPLYSYEPLEPRRLLAADLFISEFMAANRGTLLDGNNISSDWIEIHNAGDESTNLLGYSLTDNASDTTKYVLPSYTINPGEFGCIRLGRQCS